MDEHRVDWPAGSTLDLALGARTGVCRSWKLRIGRMVSNLPFIWAGNGDFASFFRIGTHSFFNHEMTRAMFHIGMSYE
jgi:hypothetical protein